jgi:hypothetical protein
MNIQTMTPGRKPRRLSLGDSLGSFLSLAYDEILIVMQVLPISKNSLLLYD